MGRCGEGKAKYPTLDAALKALDAGIAEWLSANEPDATPATLSPTKKPGRRAPAKKKTASKNLVLVESSMLTAVGYDEATKELEAVFRSGAVWRYSDVPKKVYKELLGASSIGSYMRDLIIGSYPEYQVRR